MAANIPTLQLKTKDNQVVTAPTNLILQSNKVRELHNNARGNAELRIPEVEAYELRAVVRWLTNQQGQPDYLWEVDEFTGQRVWVQLSESETALLLPMNATQLVKITCAAHYLQLESLKMASAQVMASKLRGKTLDQMRAFLNEPDDMSLEERNKIMAESPFYFPSGNNNNN